MPCLALSAPLSRQHLVTLYVPVVCFLFQIFLPAGGTSSGRPAPTGVPEDAVLKHAFP